MICDSMIALGGLILVLIYPSTWPTIIGFFLIGLGLAMRGPSAYSTAGNMKGIQPSVGIAMVTTIGYSGFFVGPPVIGFLSDIHGLRLGLCFVVLLFFIMLILAISMRREVA